MKRNHSQTVLPSHRAATGSPKVSFMTEGNSLLSRPTTAQDRLTKTSMKPSGFQSYQSSYGQQGLLSSYSPSTQFIAHQSTLSPPPTIQSYYQNSPSNFGAKISSLKAKPQREALQDQYVKSLQEELSCMDTQLKLLKSKELSKQAEVQQLEKFFGDGIPINQNILAMKNSYNDAKAGLEQKKRQLEAEMAEREELVAGLKSRVEILARQLLEEQKIARTEQIANSVVAYGLIGQQARLKKKVEIDDELHRRYKQQNRKLTESISTISRARQVELINVIRAENLKFVKLNKLREGIIEKTTEYNQLCQKLESKQRQSNDRGYLSLVESENIKLRKKEIALEKELHSLQTKIEERKMDLEQCHKEREKQTLARMDIKSRLDILKEQLGQQNTLSLEDIEKSARDQELQILHRTVQRNNITAKYIDYYARLLSEIQDKLADLIEKKPELKSEITMVTAELQQLSLQLENERLRAAELKGKIAYIQQEVGQLKTAIPVLADRTERTKEQIRLYSGEKERLNQDIDVKEKQLQLLTIIKGLDVGEAQLSRSSSQGIQEQLDSFLRNWETLQRHR